MKPFLLLLILIWFGCSGEQKLVIVSEVEAEAMLVPLSSDEESKPESVGKLPQEISLDKLIGNSLKIRFTSSQSEQNWLFLEKVEANTTIHIKDESQVPHMKNPPNTVESMDLTEINQFLRLVLKSYQALSQGNANVALQLSDLALKSNPKLSAGHILKGLALLKKGDKDDGLAQLRVAQSMDPGDESLQKLITSLEMQP